MDKLGAISKDIAIGAKATYAFWKHICQLLIELGTFGYLKFELEREHISEESLKDIQGRYLKFKVKNPVTSAADIQLTPYGETIMAQDPQEGFEGFLEDTPEFHEQIAKLNEVWYVFVGLALIMAIGAFFIHQKLLERDGIKANFAEDRREANRKEQQQEEMKQQE